MPKLKLANADNQQPTLTYLGFLLTPRKPTDPQFFSIEKRRFGTALRTVESKKEDVQGFDEKNKF